MTKTWQQSLRAELEKPVQYFEAENMTAPGVRPIFYNGAPWQERETRVFAWIGLPEGASAEHPVPAVVLAHGGGATALADWVRLWNSKGYAAISMDTCGGIPAWSENPYFRSVWPRHKFSGPAGWGNFNQSVFDPEEQWPYHAICAVLRGARVLADLPEVDASKVGITGISWGGYLTTICSGLEPERFAFSIPVYGAGFFNDPQSRLITGLPAEITEPWFDLWEPANVMANINMPILFLTDAEDFAFPLDGWDRSIRLCKSACVRRSIRKEYPHNHTVSFYSKTIYDFADCALAGVQPPDLGKVSLDENGMLHASLNTQGRQIKTVELIVTRASGWWYDRVWRSFGAKIEDDQIIADLPIGTVAAYFSVTDERDCRWTSELYLS